MGEELSRQMWALGSISKTICKRVFLMFPLVLSFDYGAYGRNEWRERYSWMDGWMDGQIYPHRIRS